MKINPEKAWLQAALDAAQAAAAVIRRHYAAGVAVETKADATPVTLADRESEQVIRELLGLRFPEHGFFGEEFGRDNDDAECLWLIDPIDGTKSFVRGYPFFSTQIALMVDGEIRVAVSSAPLFDEIAWAVRGEGAWLNGERIGCSSISRIADAALSTGNLASLAASPAWNRFGSLVREVNRIRGYGDFYHYHLLARGSIDAVIESDLNILDVAALSLIVEEAGGRFTTLSGNPVHLGMRDALATNAYLHGPLLQAIAWQRNEEN